MKSFFLKILCSLPAIAITTLLGIAPTMASETDEARWFQVELIVFEHQDPNSDEQWTERYLDNSVTEQQSFAEDVEPVIVSEHDNAQYEAEADTAPEQQITATEVQESTLIQLRHADGQAFYSTQIPAQDTGRSGSTNAASAWVLLAEPSLQLTDKSARLQKAGDYQVLFHQAWRQPMVESSEAPWIRIEGGQRYADQPVLTGSVRFSLKRYLHITTQLSLTEYEPFQNLASEIPDDYISNEANLLTPANAGSQNGYEPLRRFDLQESRRMRSNELHYLDSPVIGVLVKITPFEHTEPPLALEEELSAETAEQQDTSQTTTQTTQ
ncbi:peptidoglycan binding protein CsiV [Aestuariirhabdus sp. Z084]|uniref:CsiV family protein n=1 Tax=Aestuariirhabdus haliotis TaxID=2918751 RepID=UPI00201B457C|nr:CsiV family protein [Aestuariirhabdus haliotis]MCL6414761.1 peptidoglycan binding protein CsiV [Aestuariirhabdus haliotis]MCL6418693.1 peptidoglycan binding protein CsiV [Aestuariirhabdus haliotis]